eukprot:16844-Heterococcus_DN1.PRE.1
MTQYTYHSVGTARVHNELAHSVYYCSMNALKLHQMCSCTLSSNIAPCSGCDSLTSLLYEGSQMQYQLIQPLTCCFILRPIRSMLSDRLKPAVTKQRDTRLCVANKLKCLERLDFGGSDLATSDS